MTNYTKTRIMPAINPADNGNQQIASYPEIFYKVQPFVLLACDQLNLRGGPLTQAQADQITEEIYNNVCQMHPDLADYAQLYEMRTNDRFATMQIGPRHRPGFRRRGMLRDLIDILFLREIFGRIGGWF